MSTGTAGSGSLPGTTTAGTSAQPAKRDRYIERQLRRTRRQVRSVELAIRLMLLATAAVAFFLVAAVVDHWLVPGGLSIYGRLAFLAVFLLGGGWFVAREIAPLFVYRINPLFAAQTIERAKPTLKNSLLNFLMLRSNRAGVPEVVLNAVEEQAAANLERTSIEHVVDRTRLVQIGYLLLAMVAAFCTYYLLSPKSPLQTVGRVVLPWSDLRPPSRVEINDIQPGTATVFRGERASVSAEVIGLQEGEAVTLFFSTGDRQSVDQPLRMYVTKDSYGRHTVTLPPGAEATAHSVASAGLQQDIEYRIEAGDAVSRTYRLSVVQAPNIVVEKLDYEYPEYTRLDRLTLETTGDIRAVEGTQVTIHALANQPIASAWLDLGGDGRHKQPMQVTSGRAGGQRASATITLALNDDRTAPVFSHYLVRFATDRGHENREPIRYRIEVTPDPAPEVQVLRPDKVEAAVPLNAPVTFELKASDELYGIADLRIVANVGGEPAFRRNRSVSRDDPSAGRLVHKQVEQLDRITLAGGEKLKAGDVIEYWAEAVDNKTPKPNVTRTEVRKLVIVEPRQDQNRNQEQQQDENQGGGQGKEDQQNNNPQDRNNQQPNERDNKNQQQTGEQKNDDQKNNDQKNQQGKNDDAKNNERKNNSGEKGGNSKDKGQSKDGQPQPNDRKGQGEKKNSKTEQSQQPGNESNNADRDESKDQKSDGAKGAKGRDSEQQNSPEDTDRNQQQRQDGEGSQDNTANRQEGSKNGENRPVDKSDESAAFERILDHAKKKDGKSPEQSNDAKDDQRNAAGERDSAQSKADKGNAKGTNETKQEGEPDSDDSKQDKRADGQPGDRDEQRTKTGGSEKEPPRNGNGKQDDAQKTGEGMEKDDGAKTEKSRSPLKDDSQKAAKTGAAKDDQRKDEDRGSEKTGSGQPSPEQNPRPMTDDRAAGESGAKKDDDQKKQSTGPASKAKSDASKRPNDEQKAVGDSGEKTNDNESADERSGGSGAKKSDKSGAEKQDDSKSGASSSGQKNEKSKSGEKKGPSDKGVPPNDANGQPGQNRNEKDGNSDSQKDGQPGNSPPRGGNDTNRAKNDAPDGKGTATGGGQREESAPPPDEPPVPPEDDPANLEYAKRATDLALDHLRNQLKDDRPDKELLDRLGWSKEDLQKLLARWERLEREAKQPGPTGAKARQELQDRISGLGMRPGKTSRKASTTAGDAAHGLRDSARSAPPAEYKEAYEAFKRRTSQGAK